MNRDEQKERKEEKELFQTRPFDNGIKTIYPIDSVSQGTWFGFNEYGITLALLNRYQDPLIENAKSRGSIIPSLLPYSSMKALLNALLEKEFSQFNPFDLVIIDQQNVHKLSWNGKNTSNKSQSTSHAFFLSSSSINTEKTLAYRQSLFERYLVQNNEESNCQFRILHDFHLLQDKADLSASIRMQRENTHTKSISQLRAGPTRLDYSYFNEESLCSFDCTDKLNASHRIKFNVFSDGVTRAKK